MAESKVDTSGLVRAGRAFEGDLGISDGADDGAIGGGDDDFEPQHEGVLQSADSQEFENYDTMEMDLQHYKSINSISYSVLTIIHSSYSATISGSCNRTRGYANNTTYSCC